MPFEFMLPLFEVVPLYAAPACVVRVVNHHPMSKMDLPFGVLLDGLWSIGGVLITVVCKFSYHSRIWWGVVCPFLL